MKVPILTALFGYFLAAIYPPSSLQKRSHQVDTTTPEDKPQSSLMWRPDPNLPLASSRYKSGWTQLSGMVAEELAAPVDPTAIGVPLFRPDRSRPQDTRADHIAPFNRGSAHRCWGPPWP